MKLSNHNNFLNSKDEYEKARLFWKVLFNKLKENPYEFVENTYKNGESIMDGNPLFTAAYDNIAVRIIQNKITASEPIFTSWIQQSYIKDIQINELVIYLQPLNYLLDDITKLIEQHLHNKLSNEYIHNLNKKYQVRWDRLRSKKIIRRLESLNLLEEQLVNNIVIDNDRLKEFTRLISVENIYINVAAQRVINPVSNALHKVETRVQKLNRVITLKGNLAMRKAPNIKSYNSKIKKIYSSKSNFNKSLIVKINDLREEVNELKNKL